MKLQFTFDYCRHATSRDRSGPTRFSLPCFRAAPHAHAVSIHWRERKRERESEREREGERALSREKWSALRGKGKERVGGWGREERGRARRKSLGKTAAAARATIISCWEVVR